MAGGLGIPLEAVAEEVIAEMPESLCPEHIHRRAWHRVGDELIQDVRGIDHGKKERENSGKG